MIEQKMKQLAEQLRRYHTSFLNHVGQVSSCRYSQLSGPEQKYVDGQVQANMSYFMATLDRVTDVQQYKQWVLEMILTGMIQYNYFMSGFSADVRTALAQFDRVGDDRKINQFKSFVQLREFLDNYNTIQ